MAAEQRKKTNCKKVYIFPQAKARCKIEIDTILCTGLVLVFYFCDRGFCFVRVGWEILFRMYYCVYTKPCGRLLGLGNANCRPCIIFSLPCLSMLFYVLSDHIFHAKKKSFKINRHRPNLITCKVCQSASWLFISIWYLI